MEPVDATRLTICMGDSFHFGRNAVYRAIVEMLADEGTAGATVVHRKRVAALTGGYTRPENLDLSADLPGEIIAVNWPEKIEVVLPRLDDMVDKGMVTTEPARIIFSRPAAL